MKNRATASALLIATLAVSGLAGGTLAQEPSESADDAATSKSTTGTVVAVVDEDGNTGYFLDVDGTLVELSYGPSWFWGEDNPLQALVGIADTVIGGQLRDGAPNEHASDTAKENAAKAPALKVRSINGSERDKGKPPWAGGPKAVGEAHPGYEGWSKGQAAKPEKAAKPAKPEKAAKPEKSAGGRPG